MYRIDVTPIIGVLLACVAAFVAAVVPEREPRLMDLSVPRSLDGCCGCTFEPNLLTPHLGIPFLDEQPNVVYVTFDATTAWGDVIARMDAIRDGDPDIHIAIDPVAP